MEAEIQKENIPPRLSACKGTNRIVVHQSPSCSTRDALSQKAAEDPLATWLKRLEDAEGENLTDKQIMDLYSKCCESFQDDPRYLDDSRYVSTWVKFCLMTSNPDDVFRYMYKKRIGKHSVAYYVAWAMHLAERGEVPKAKRVFLQAVEKKAQPNEQLEHAHAEFRRIYCSGGAEAEPSQSATTHPGTTRMAYPSVERRTLPSGEVLSWEEMRARQPKYAYVKQQKNNGLGWNGAGGDVGYVTGGGLLAEILDSHDDMTVMPRKRGGAAPAHPAVHPPLHMAPLAAALAVCDDMTVYAKLPPPLPAQHLETPSFSGFMSVPNSTNPAAAISAGGGFRLADIYDAHDVTVGPRQPIKTTHLHSNASICGQGNQVGQYRDAGEAQNETPIPKGHGLVDKFGAVPSSPFTLGSGRDGGGFGLADYLDDCDMTVVAPAARKPVQRKDTQEDEGKCMGSPVSTQIAEGRDVLVDGVADVPVQEPEPVMAVYQDRGDVKNEITRSEIKQGTQQLNNEQDPQTNESHHAGMIRTQSQGANDFLALSGPTPHDTGRKLPQPQPQQPFPAHPTTSTSNTTYYGENPKSHQMTTEKLKFPSSGVLATNQEPARVSLGWVGGGGNCGLESALKYDDSLLNDHPPSKPTPQSNPLNGPGSYVIDSNPTPTSHDYRPADVKNTATRGEYENEHDDARDVNDNDGEKENENPVSGVDSHRSFVVSRRRSALKGKGGLSKRRVSIYGGGDGDLSTAQTAKETATPSSGASDSGWWSASFDRSTLVNSTARQQLVQSTPMPAEKAPVDESICTISPVAATRRHTRTDTRPASDVSLSTRSVSGVGTSNSVLNHSDSKGEVKAVVAKPRRVNPLDPDNIAALLAAADMTKIKGVNWLKDQTLGTIKVDSQLTLGNNQCVRVNSVVGEGAWAKVYKVAGNDAKNLLAMKQTDSVQGPWELYISRTIRSRLQSARLDGPSELYENCYGFVQSGHVFADSTVLLMDYLDQGTLLDAVSAWKSEGKNMPDVLVMFYTIELLRLLDALHACDILHGDIKPDNFLIRQGSEVPREIWCKGSKAWSAHGLQLMDFGRSLDLRMYPSDCMFEGSSKTEKFVCVEMKNGQPWRFQADTYGLLGTVYVMLMGDYMDVECVDGRWRPTRLSLSRRYLGHDLYPALFSDLLNSSNPAASTSTQRMSVLQQHRRKFEQCLNTHCSVALGVDRSLAEKLRSQVNALHFWLKGKANHGSRR